MEESTRCANRSHAPPVRTSRPASASSAARSSRGMLRVFQLIPSDPPGCSCPAHTGIVSASSCAGVRDLRPPDVDPCTTP